MNKHVVSLAALLMMVTTVNAEEKAAATEEAQPAQTAAAQVKSSNNPENGKQYGDWLKECEIITEADGKEIEICQLVQPLTAPESEQVFVKVAIGYVPGKENAVMVISLPLGIYLPPGVQMQVDEKGKVGRIPVNTCLPAGCQAGAELDADFTSRMKQGNVLRITFGNPEGQPVLAEVSLNGITAGLDSLK